MNTNTDPVRALIGEMTEYLDQQVDPELDVIAKWRDRLEAAIASAPPSAPTHPEFRVGVDVTRDGAHVVVLRCEGDAGEVIYSEVHPLRAPPSAPVGVDLPINDAVPAPTETRPGNLFLWNWTAMQQYGRACIAHALSQQPAAVDGDEVRRVAQHIGTAADYIDKAYPDAKMLDRGPILRNMRRWHERLTAAIAAPQQPGTLDPRSTHRVFRNDEWLPCYCAATRDHWIGGEVMADSRQPAAPSGEAVAWLRMKPDGTPDWAEDCIGSDDRFLDHELASDGYYLQPLYAAPQQPAAGVGEEIMVNAAHDVYTLPLQPSGLLSGPRFVVHVPGPQQPAAVEDRNG